MTIFDSCQCQESALSLVCCLSILVMALSTSSSVNSGISSVSGLDFIVLSGVGTVWV